MFLSSGPWDLPGLRRNVSGMLDSDRLIVEVFLGFQEFFEFQIFLTFFGYQSWVDFEKFSNRKFYRAQNIILMRFLEFLKNFTLRTHFSNIFTRGGKS